jgi:hypothetical protein
VRKKQLGEDQACDGAIEEEIVPLDRGADGGRDDGAAKLNLMFAGAERHGVCIERCHARLLCNSLGSALFSSGQNGRFSGNAPANNTVPAEAASCGYQTFEGLTGRRSFDGRAGRQGGVCLAKSVLLNVKDVTSARRLWR